MLSVSTVGGVQGRLRKFRHKQSVALRAIEQRLAVFVRDLPSGGTVVDIGAARARWRGLFPDAERYVAFDIEALPELTFVASATRIPLQDETVDVAIATEVIEHVADVGAALSEVQRVLKDGGVLLLSVPLIWGEHASKDFYRWTATGIQRVLRAHGLEVVRVAKRGGIFRAIASLIDEVPYQLLVDTPGPFSEMSIGQRMRFLTAATIQVLITPLPWLITTLDHFDRQKRFTLGYVLLARKESSAHHSVGSGLETLTRSRGLAE